MRYRICLVTLFYSILLQTATAQDSVLFKNLNNADYAFSNRNALGSASSPAVIFPSGSGKTALKKLNFWLTGLESTGDTLAIATDMFTSRSSWIPGPAAISGTREHPAFAEWDHFYEVSSAEILYHRNNYNSGSYTMPGGISRWPSAYSVSGFPSLLAPYADFNLNNVYDPGQGDFPFVPGQKNIFTMSSDSAASLFPAANSHPLDLSVLWFVPENPDSVENTVFFRLTVCNRRDSAIQNLKMSAVADFGIGDPNDNFIATDVTYGAITGYNTPGPDTQYGSAWPTVSIGWLSRAASNSIYFENSSDNVKGKPVSQSDFYQLSNGSWKTGKFLSFGSSGLDGSTPASFVFSNGTDPAQSNKDWDEPPGTAGRRTGLISTGGWKLEGKSCQVADGFIMITGNAPDSATIRIQLEKNSRFYDKANWSLGTDKDVVAVPKPLLYPNPVKKGSIVSVSGSGIKNDDPVRIYSLTGIQIGTTIYRNQGFRMDYPAGMYFVRIGNSHAVPLLITE